MTNTIVQRPKLSPARPANSLRTPCILCIDDDPDIHTNIELRLREYDVTVEHAYYGMQGIVESMSAVPDLIITDMAMPNGDGQYLVDSVRANPHTASVPIIVLTGMRDPKIRKRALSAGADAFLNKPIRFDDLLATIKELVPIASASDQVD